MQYTIFLDNLVFLVKKITLRKINTLEDYQIAGLMMAATVCAGCLREFWKAFGGPDLRPRPRQPEPRPVIDMETYGEPVTLPPFPRSVQESGTDEVFISTLSSQPDYEEIVRENALNNVRPYEENEFDPDTVARVSRKRKEHEMKMNRLRKAGLKLDEY